MFEANGDLLTSGATGVRRWPVQLDSDRNEFRIGPPRDLPFSKGSGQIAEDRLGRIIAAARETHAEVLISGRLTPDRDRWTIAVTLPSAPTGNGWRPAVTIWAPRSGASVMPRGGQASRQYGHGRRLQPGWEMADDGTSPCRLWSTGTWALARELGGSGLCFSPDSRLVAVLDANRSSAWSRRKPAA